MKFGRILMFAVVAFVTVGGTSTQAQIITTFGSGASAFNIEFIEIGNPGNSADTTGSPNPAGAVNYIYCIGKYEVTREMINKANTAGSLGISMANMTGYSRGSELASPATGITWNEAARFVNWLNASKGFQPAYRFLRPTDANITLWDVAQSSGTNRFRHKDAVYFLPSVDEWYKAAYGSSNGTWYNYATGSDSLPTSVTAGTSGAVYGNSSFLGPADVTDAGSLSSYGTMAQTGNVWEWNETASDLTNDFNTDNRVRRGGSWETGSGLFDSSFRTQNLPDNENDSTGFRIASVPEPSAVSLLVVGLGGVMTLRRVRRKAD